MEGRVPPALESRLGLERLVEGLDDALRACETAVRDRGHVQPLVRKLAVGEIDARDLEERDPVSPGIDVAPRRLDQAGQQRCAERGQLYGDRLGQLPLRLGLGGPRRRVRSRETVPATRGLPTQR